MKLVKLYFLPWFTSRPPLSGPAAPQELPTVRLPAVCGSPLFLTHSHNVTSARTCTVAESTGIHGHKGAQPL